MQAACFVDFRIRFVRTQLLGMTLSEVRPLLRVNHLCPNDLLLALVAVQLRAPSACSDLTLFMCSSCALYAWSPWPVNGQCMKLTYT